MPFAILLIAGAQAAKSFTPYIEARPILDALRRELIPPELRVGTLPEIEAIWPAWAMRRDAAIRARVAQGDEDSVIYFLMFGTTFTARSRATDRELEEFTRQPAAAVAWLRPRIDDFVTAMVRPDANERLRFARRVLERKGDPATAAGRVEVRRYLEERAVAMVSAGAVRSSALLNPATQKADAQTLFKDRGLSSDTSIFIDYGIDQTIRELRQKQAFDVNTVKRVAIIGPGLDFSDKLEGYDFYPQQTIQPFAAVDSLLRYDLAAPDLQVTAFDLSPRIIQHLDAARDRSRAGNAYRLVLPRNLDRPWTPDLVEYWGRLGGWIGADAKAAPPPPNAGRLQVRSVDVRPSIVQTLVARDLDIVFEQVETPAPADQFDLVIATNILLYYDVFEQSLAAANIARMLRPGGILLTNNQIFELPPIPLGGVGYTDVTYMALPGIGDTGDRIVWYQRR